MKLDLRNLSGSLEFTHQYDLSDMEFYGAYPVVEPLDVRGMVQYHSGILEFTAVAATTLHCACDRCGVPFLRDKTIEISCALVENLQCEEYDDLYVLENGFCDVDEIVMTAFILDMDTKTLCAENCLGLCQKCGHNLNEGSCSCSGKDIDPRLAKLMEFAQREGL